MPGKKKKKRKNPQPNTEHPPPPLLSTPRVWAFSSRCFPWVRNMKFGSKECLWKTDPVPARERQELSPRERGAAVGLGLGLG